MAKKSIYLQVVVIFLAWIQLVNADDASSQPQLVPTSLAEIVPGESGLKEGNPQCLLGSPDCYQEELKNATDPLKSLEKSQTQVDKKPPQEILRNFSWEGSDYLEKNPVENPFYSGLTEGDLP